MDSQKERNYMQGRVVWITGLSGAGKSTMARALCAQISNTTNAVIVLDGDELRKVFGATHNGFDMHSRKHLALAYARLARLLAFQGQTVIVATISLFHVVHAWNRENLPNYLEVFLDIPESVRRSRDPKGLYAAAQRGEIDNMAGIHCPVELPLQPHLYLDATESIESSLTKILQLLT